MYSGANDRTMKDLCFKTLNNFPLLYLPVFGIRMLDNYRWKFLDVYCVEDDLEKTNQKELELIHNMKQGELKYLRTI
ncbi:hypothetical protein Glove_680g56 [Diversispora epigaea]|uniref:Uncharacterized protein n=1 Tax=Diversispora epigaea TaxID=1348612 RepID=A0A397G6X9_9GLOM|nr:hypothetical protein Glove_680g56 [Diversispora epigaea]